MLHLLKSNRAFNRTSAHPLDSSVRIAHHKDDLAALHSNNKVRAVIFKRKQSDAVTDDLRRYEQIILDENMSHAGSLIEEPKIRRTWLGRRYDSTTASQNLQACPAILADIFNVARIYHKACGNGPYTAPHDPTLRQWLLNLNNEEAKQEALKGCVPHTDGMFKVNNRMTCGYAVDPKNMGTGWFPGTFDKEEERHIRNEFRDAENPQTVLDKYNHQRTDAGDLIFFHTPHHKSGSKQLELMHTSSIPQSNKVRLSLLLPT